VTFQSCYRFVVVVVVAAAAPVVAEEVTVAEKYPSRFGQGPLQTVPELTVQA